MPTEHNNRLPPVGDKRRVLWRRGQRKFALRATVFFGHRKSRERGEKVDTLTVYDRAFLVIIIILNYYG